MADWNFGMNMGMHTGPTPPGPYHHQHAPHQGKPEYEVKETSIIDSNNRIPQGWQLATRSDVYRDMYWVKELLQDRFPPTKKYMLADGRVHGKFHDYEVDEEQGKPGFDDMLLKRVTYAGPGGYPPQGYPPHGGGAGYPPYAGPGGYPPQGFGGQGYPPQSCGRYCGPPQGFGGPGCPPQGFGGPSGFPPQGFGYPGFGSLTFRVEENGDIPDGWRLASVDEVERELDAVKGVIGSDMEWHVVKLDGGKISGPGYDYSVERTWENEDLGHMLLVQQ